MTRRILIVDDEFGLAELLGELLTEEGYETTVAINGQLGLESLASNPADLVVLDVIMPIMGGPDMARAMKASAALARIPIILTRALPASLPDKRLHLYDAFLCKPFSPEQLFATTTTLLSEH